MTDLVKAINDLVEKNTFSLEAIEAIKKLRDNAEDMEVSLKNKNEEIVRVSQTLNQISNDLDSANRKVLEYVNREVELVKREADISNLEKIRAVSDAKAIVLAGVVDSMFKNTIVRESICRNVPVAVPSGSYVQNQSVSDYSTMEKVPG